MGEYHTVRLANGEIDYRCKLGTMDDWRYVRRSEAEALARLDAGVSANVGHALQQPTVLYRFPWPDEDHAAGKIRHIAERDMFRTFTVPVAQDLIDFIEHREHWVSMGAAHQGGAYNVNIAVPCPLSGAFRERGFTNSGATPILQILGTRTDADGQSRTIFGCGYCEQCFALPATPCLVAVQATLRAWRPQEPWYAHVAERLQPRPGMSTRPATRDTARKETR